jgi:aldose 1-epimerase
MISHYSSKSEERQSVQVYSLAEAGTAVADVAPSLGTNCFSFRTDTLDVLEPIPFSEFLRKPTSYGIPILFPFPNRNRDGRFTFQGQTYTVDPPRHGYVRDKPWSVVAHGASDEEGA